VAHPQIAAFARLAKENTPPTRLLYGQKTLLSRTMHDIKYDAIHDEFVVANPFAQAILTFRGAADGEEPPIRIIQGPSTQLRDLQRIEIDPVHNEMFVPSGNSILVFRREASGNVEPVRVIRGPNTRLRQVETVAVDPARNTLVTGADMFVLPRGGGAIAMFDRTASGDAKPRAVIAGPKTGIVRIIQIRISPKGWLVAAQPGIREEQEPEGVFVGVWHVSDNGDVPPRWRLSGPGTTLKKPRGVALNPKNQELIIADMRLNSVLTYYFPEIF
jgi:hypothetical protein